MAFGTIGLGALIVLMYRRKFKWNLEDIMIGKNEHFHGSDVEKVEAVYGVKKEDIINFSGNVNPLGISPMLREALAAHVDAIASYPDREYGSLRKAIAAYGKTEYENVIVGNGSTELISLFIRAVNPGKALVVAPTYSEYEREITLNGGVCHYYALQEAQEFELDVERFLKQLQAGPDLLILCNPNNPTSSLISRQDMETILTACRQRDIFVLVDETYMEFVENYEDITAIPLTAYYKNLVVLRGTSKFFAVPGLRLGYAVTGNQTLSKSIHRQQNPWSLHALAAAAGEAMFQDQEYIHATHRLISEERQRMYRLFSKDSRFHPYLPKANFMLLRICADGLSSEKLFTRAIQQKMMIRDCSDFLFLSKEYIRFCFLSPEKNDRLANCLLI